ncbi:MAG: hypothetical protein WDO15_26365 [Bacteroidota bacterium]
MVRIKLPFGRITTKQIRRIAGISDEYASSNLHATTRQDIQIHFVSLDKTPELWAKLEQDDITTREACGNTVRNIQHRQRRVSTGTSCLTYRPMLTKCINTSFAILFARRWDGR